MTIFSGWLPLTEPPCHGERVLVSVMVAGVETVDTATFTGDSFLLSRFGFDLLPYAWAPFPDPAIASDPE